MSMDVLFIEAVVRELRESLCPAAIAKIHQPGPHEIVLHLWNGREKLRLLISASPGASRIHLTSARLPNPPVPPRFCQLLRSRLNRLIEVERMPGERIVLLRFSGEHETRWTLIAELLGQRANILLLDGNERIVDALHRREEQGRGALPGQPYSPPPHPPRIDLAEQLPAPPPGVALRAWLLERVTPMTPLIADDLTAAVASGLAAENALDRFRCRWLSGDFKPFIGNIGNKLVLATVLPDFLEISDVRRFVSPSQAADLFYAARSEGAVFGGGKEDLERLVRKEIIRLQKRLDHLATEEEKARDCERQLELGNLLLANLHRLRRGATTAVLDDWYASEPGEVTITLDPALSPQENVEAYFRRYRKGHRGLEHLERRRRESLAELEWLEETALALEEAESSRELPAIREELEAAGLLRSSSAAGKKGVAAEPQEQVRRAVSPGGYPLVWGRNNRGNDLVSKQSAGSDDLWFHALALPGCHLVLKRGERKGEVPEEDVLFAAALAAGYSRGKEAAKVEVMVSQGRWVRRPKGARPGLVTVERWRTVVVRPQRLDDREG